jgi:hypothetical protein
MPAGRVPNRMANARRFFEKLLTEKYPQRYPRHFGGGFDFRVSELGNSIKTAMAGHTRPPMSIIDNRLNFTFAVLRCHSSNIPQKLEGWKWQFLARIKPLAG